MQDRNAGERPCRAARDGLIRGPRLREASLLVQRDDGVQARVVAPDPIQDVLDDPGTGMQTVDAAAVADAVARLEQAPQVEEYANPSAYADMPMASGPVVTTIGPSDMLASIAEPQMHPEDVPVPETEQVMLTKNVQHVAQQLLDSNMTNTELTWQQDGQQYSARVMRQPAADSTGLEQVIAEIMTSKDGKRMKTRLSLKRLAFSHFTQLVNSWDPNIMLHDDVIDGRFHSNTEIGVAFSGGVEPRFFGKVTTSASKMTFDNLGMRKRSKNIFQGGIETRTERVSLPRDMPAIAPITMPTMTAISIATSPTAIEMRPP